IGGAAANLIVGMDWSLTLLFGALVAVGGPTVIMPIVRQMRLGRNISHVLTAEAMLIDVIGAILAIVFLQVALTLNLSGMDIAEALFYKVAIGITLGL
ncbi:MAG: sodium:proton antiporter, partial [Deltaproteobacteria bacterium]|nr:sodium:proton antiporter [Deltaproteobacteria bacterium]